MTTAQVVETSVTVNNNSPIQDYVHPDDQTQPTFEMTPGFKPFTVLLLLLFVEKYRDVEVGFRVLHMKFCSGKEIQRNSKFVMAILRNIFPYSLLVYWIALHCKLFRSAEIFLQFGSLRW